MHMLFLVMQGCCIHVLLCLYRLLLEAVLQQSYFICADAIGAVHCKKGDRDRYTCCCY
jgi:hypothetical protein